MKHFVLYKLLPLFRWIIVISEKELNEKHFLKRLELIKKSALITKDFTPEEMLTRGLELILNIKNAKFYDLREE